MKKSYYEMQDTYIKHQNKRSNLKLLYHRKKDKQKWYRLKHVFGKKQMKSISAVKYVKDGNIIRLTNQIEIEFVITTKNIYSSNIFKKKIFFICFIIQKTKKNE